MDKIFKVVQMGLGPIGTGVTKYLIEKSNIEIVGAIDSDLSKCGKDLGSIAGLSTTGITISDDLDRTLKNNKVDALILTTTSSLIGIYDQLSSILPFGVNVISSCEELSYPWSNPQIAEKIDILAKNNEVSVLGTGVNPGYLMDYLPMVLSGVCEDVKKITVERIQDAKYRRLPFQLKIGANTTVDEFNIRVKAGKLKHVGLSQSINMIASFLGWKIDRIDEVISPIVAVHKIKLENSIIEPGKVLGVQQIGLGIVNGEDKINMIFRATIDDPEPRDRIIIDGSPPIDMLIKNGVNGDIATCAILVNSIPNLIQSTPGLKTMLDINPPHYHL
jgi:4-hydroxy-tetrahydrodipicolinate reductase